MGLHVMDTKNDVPMSPARSSAQSPLPLSSLRDFLCSPSPGPPTSLHSVFTRNSPKVQSGHASPLIPLIAPQCLHLQSELVSLPARAHLLPSLSLLCLIRVCLSSLCSWPPGLCLSLGFVVIAVCVWFCFGDGSLTFLFQLA